MGATKDLKGINPVEISKYAVANNIDHKPAFGWGVPFNLQKRNRIVSKSQNKYWRTTIKFGIEVLTSFKQAYDIYDNTGNGFWR